ncbi:MAG: DUF952 domain-containing protein [Rubripirellula sp.]
MLKFEAMLSIGLVGCFLFSGSGCDRNQTLSAKKTSPTSESDALTTAALNNETVNQETASVNDQEVDEHRSIYHLVIASDFQNSVDDECFRPASLSSDGFAHCAFRESVVSVANQFFPRGTGDLLLLEIDPKLVSAETRYEEAKPVDGSDAEQPASTKVFPHVYGAIDSKAIRGVGQLTSNDDGFAWPSEFTSLQDFLSASESD